MSDSQSAGNLIASCDPIKSNQELVLPSEAVELVEGFKQMTDPAAGGADVLLAGVLAAVQTFKDKNAAVEISLRASLSKDQIQPEPDPSPIVKVVYYLFAANLLQDLETIALDRFESNFCEAQKRTVIVVFDTSVFLTGEFLAVCGRDQESELKDWLAVTLRSETLERVTSVLVFRKSESIGEFPAKWITPDFFALKVATEQKDEAQKLQRQFESFQALLSALFLADYVDSADGSLRVEYRGIGVAKFEVGRNELLASDCSLDALYRLYSYAYEGLLTDKLEIVQQFLSFMANSASTLCSKALEAHEAAQKTYAVVLREKVSVYFEALTKIQDRIKTAVDKSAEGVINLSRDVSGDLYKVAGVIAGAIAGMLLKPDLGWPVALAASLVIATYLALVVFYHLGTLRRAYDLGIEQHLAFIESFDGQLGRDKIDKFRNDPHLKQAKELFAEKLEMAERVYAAFVLISMIVVQTSIHKLCTV